jgi:hypothetical protein
MSDVFNSIVSEERLRSKFDKLALGISEKLKLEIIERSEVLLRFRVECFEATVGCDTDRGSVTDCTITYTGAEERSDLLDLFYINSISEVLRLSIPAVQWRRDGKQMKDPISRMKAIFSAVSVFVRKTRADGAKLTNKIEEYLEASHK